MPNAPTVHTCHAGCPCQPAWREVDRLRRVIWDAINVMGPGDDEDSESAANMAFAVLTHGLGEGH